MREETTLWYYIHEEAEVQVGGRRLGEIGDCIVSDVVFGLVEGDPNSLLSKEPDWKPKLTSRVEDNFTVGDLLRLAGELAGEINHPSGS